MSTIPTQARRDVAALQPDAAELHGGLDAAVCPIRDPHEAALEATEEDRMGLAQADLQSRGFGVLRIPANRRLWP